MKFIKLWIALAAVLVTWGVARLAARPVLAGVSFSQEIVDRNGALLRLTLAADDKYRVFRRLDEIDPRYLEAVLLLEDRYFYSHPGINPVALARAALGFAGGHAHAGASTLTMQLARVRYGLQTKTLAGKARQIFVALGLELTHSKRELLEAYVNLVPFGANVEGIGAASRIYFNRDAKSLALPELLSLAVIPQSPTARKLSEGGPVTGASLVRARERLAAKWLAQHPADRAFVGALELPLAAQKLKELPFSAPHFVDLVHRLQPDARRVATTLDLQLQSELEARVRAYVGDKRGVGVSNAAAMIVDTRTAEVLALVGSRDYHDEDIEGQINGALAKRSPGSTLKPFIYALAAQQGLIHSRTLLKDVPTSYGAYDPENIDQRYLGPLAAEDALVQSRNLPAVELVDQLKEPTFYDFLKKAHVVIPRDPKHYGLGIALGGAELSMWELAGLYTMMARLGDWVPLQAVKGAPAPRGERLLTRESARLVLEMLTKNPRPDQGLVETWVRTRYPVAWKTGTSSGYRDAWSVGVVGPYVLAVWLGNFDNEPNPALLGREMAGPLFFAIADGLAARENLDEPPWRQARGLGIKKVEVCALSGFLRGPHCPHAVLADFIPGVSPIRTCEIHRAVRVNPATGLRMCDETATSGVEKVFEFWPTDLLALFRSAGIALKSPPPFEKGCKGLDRLAEGRPPRIVSPRDQVTYFQSVSTRAELNTLSFRAVADADARELYWFVNKRFWGRSRPDSGLEFPARVGDYVVSVVDDLGREDSRKVTVRAVQ